MTVVTLHDESWAVRGFERNLAVETGHFVLTSKPLGSDLKRHSGHYVNKDFAGSDPRFVVDLAGRILRIAPEEWHSVNLVVAPATGAISFGFALAWHIGCRFLFCEQEGDEFVFKRGFGGLIPRIMPARYRALVAEDIITSGRTVNGTIKLVQDSGGIVVGAAVEWLRGELDLGPILLLAGVNKMFPSFPAETCHLCRAGVPINAEPGHGDEFLAEYGSDPANWPANKQT